MSGRDTAVWTAGQLRAALDGVPDEVRIRVIYDVVDDDDTGDDQLVVHAALDAFVWYRDTRTHEPPRTSADGWFTLSSMFPPEDYLRGPH